MLWPVVTRESGRGQRELRELSSRADWYYYHHHFPELRIQSPKSPKDNHLYLWQKINVVCTLINFVLVYVGCLWHVGFHLMLKSESPRNIFRIWMAQKWNRNKLRGLIYDHACGAHRYFLNWEPNNFKNFYFIVDSCHYQGQRRMKKANPSTKKSSHLGCSESYSFHTAAQRWSSPFPGKRANALSSWEADPITQTNEVPELHANTHFIFQCAQFVDNGKIVK